MKMEFISGTDCAPLSPRVTVPSVDVDWEGFAAPLDETDEETRFVIVPFNTNSVSDVRHVVLNDPFDDERNGRPPFTYGSPVNPTITLHWEANNDLGLVHDKKAIKNGIRINAKTVALPLDFSVHPLRMAHNFKIYTKGLADDDGVESVDTIRGRIVNLDLDIDANYDGKIDELDESLEETAGGIVCVSNNLTPIELTLEPAKLPGNITLHATMGTGRIRLWRNTNRTGPVGLDEVWTQATMPIKLYVEGMNSSTTPRDVELTVNYDENPQGGNNPLFKCSDKIRLTVVKINLITPAGDPVAFPVDGGDGSGSVPDGANEFTFSAVSSGVLTLKLKAHVTPSGIADQIKGQVHFTVDGIGTSTLAWNTSNLGGKPTASGDNLLATVTFTGLPANNSDFGAKKQLFILMVISRM
ncbi:MAG: hypothetical protein GX230_00860 [Lentisphaerae bacterium]|nr:hypothetical protein [Lentisphaerota bacterium]